MLHNNKCTPIHIPYIIYIHIFTYTVIYNSISIKYIRIHNVHNITFKMFTNAYRLLLL